ncbi:MAG: amidase, partial [Gemmatimonadales bacterium]
MQRRQFVVAGLVSGALRASGFEAKGPKRGRGDSAFADQGVELQEATLAQLQAWMTSGRVTSRGLVEQYLARNAANDRTGAGLHAVIETNPDAR